MTIPKMLPQTSVLLVQDSSLWLCWLDAAPLINPIASQVSKESSTLGKEAFTCLYWNLNSALLSCSRSRAIPEPELSRATGISAVPLPMCSPFPGICSPQKSANGIESPVTYSCWVLTEEFLIRQTVESQGSSKSQEIHNCSCSTDPTNLIVFCLISSPGFTVF